MVSCTNPGLPMAHRGYAWGAAGPLSRRPRPCLPRHRRRRRTRRLEKPLDELDEPNPPLEDPLLTLAIETRYERGRRRLEVLPRRQPRQAGGRRGSAIGGSRRARAP